MSLCNTLHNKSAIKLRVQEIHISALIVMPKLFNLLLTSLNT